MNSALTRPFFVSGLLLLAFTPACRTPQSAAVKSPAFASLARPPLPVPGVSVSVGYSDLPSSAVWALKKLGQNPNKYYYASPAFPIAENMAIVPLRVAQESVPFNKGGQQSPGWGTHFTDHVNSLRIGRGKNGDSDVFEVDIADIKGIVPGQETSITSRQTYSESYVRPQDGTEAAAVIYIKDPKNYFKPAEIMPFSLNGVQVGQTLVTVDYRRTADQESKAIENTKDDSSIPPGKASPEIGEKTLGVMKVKSISRRADKTPPGPVKREPKVENAILADKYDGNAIFTEAVDLAEAPFATEDVDRGQANVESEARASELGAFAMVYEDGAWRVAGFVVGPGVLNEPKTNILANVHNASLGSKIKKLGVNLSPTGYDSEGRPNARADKSADAPQADDDKGQDRSSDSDKSGPKDGGDGKSGGSAKR